MNASSQLVADAAQEQVRGGRDTAADHDPVRGDYRNHVGDPDPEIASNVGQPFNRTDVAGARPCHRLLGGGGARCDGDLIGASECLQAAAVPTVAPRPVGLDRLVPDLPGRPVMPLEHLAIHGDDSADARPEGQPDHRGGASSRAQAKLSETERARIVDQECRQR